MDRKVRGAEVRSLLAVNPEALGALKSGRTMQTVAVVLAFPADFTLGYGIVGAIGDKKNIANDNSNGELIALGTVAIATVVVLNVAGNAQVRKAVRTYNNGLQTTSEISFGITPSGGVGICYTF